MNTINSTSRKRLTLLEIKGGWINPDWVVQNQKALALIEDLRKQLEPNGQPRDWGQMGTCQGLITSFEIIVKSSELARRWMGDPAVPLIRIAEEIARLNEGWTRSKAEEVLEFRMELMS
jgi:hypothetical protein